MRRSGENYWPFWSYPYGGKQSSPMLVALRELNRELSEDAQKAWSYDMALKLAHGNGRREAQREARRQAGMNAVYGTLLGIGIGVFLDAVLR